MEERGVETVFNLLVLDTLGRPQEDIKESGNSGCPWGVDLVSTRQPNTAAPGRMQHMSM